jgi:hypothetical protein
MVRGKGGFYVPSHVRPHLDPGLWACLDRLQGGLALAVERPAKRLAGHHHPEPLTKRHQFGVFTNERI